MKIEIKHLAKSFPDVTPLKDVSLTISQGEVITFIGPSGTGKSTLVKCINKLITPTSGDILIDGKSILAKDADIASIRRKIGIVFQSYNLFANLTILENIMVPQIDILKKSKQEAFDKAKELLKRVGLLEKAFAYPDECSGGQQQRAAIARALAIDPEVIILDEPTSALDPTTIGEVEDVITKLAESGKTIILVTHQLDFAKKISSKIVFMSDGYFVEEGTPEEIFDHPKNESTKRFVRQLKCLDLDISSKDYDFITYANKVRVFCNAFNLSREKTNYALLAYEEVVHNHLVKKLKENLRVLYSLTFDEEKNDMCIEIKYNGEKYNPFSSKDFSMSMTKKFAKGIHSLIKEDEFTNKLKIEFKQ